MTRPRLWVVSELYYPEETSTGYFLTGIAEGLANRFDVGVVCSPPTYSERALKTARRERRHGVDIRRTRSTTFDKDWMPGRLLNMLTFTLGVLAFAIRHFRRGDRVLIVTNPPLLPLLLGLVVRAKGLRGMLLVHDVYPEVLHATGHVAHGGRASGAIERVMRAAFRSYGTVVVLGRDMAEVVGRKLLPRQRMVTIPNWGDPVEVAPVPRGDNPFARAHGLVDKVVVQFSGNLGRTHDVAAVLDLARALRGREELVFLFVGFGGKAREIAAASGALPNVVFAPRQPREMLGPMLACSDATVIAFVEGMYGVSVPSRMYNVMAAGAPIVALADPRSELSLVVAEEKCGWVVPDAAGLRAVVEGLLTPEGRAEAAARGANGRAAMLRAYTVEQVVARFAEALGTDSPPLEGRG